MSLTLSTECPPGRRTTHVVGNGSVSVESMHDIFRRHGPITRVHKNITRRHHLPQHLRIATTAVGAESSWSGQPTYMAADHFGEAARCVSQEFKHAHSWSDYIQAMGVQHASLQHSSSPDFVGPTFRDLRVIRVERDRVRESQIAAGLCPSLGRYGPVLAIQGPQRGKLLLSPNAKGDPLKVGRRSQKRLISTAPFHDVETWFNSSFITIGKAGRNTCTYREDHETLLLLQGLLCQRLDGFSHN